MLFSKHQQGTLSATQQAAVATLCGPAMVSLRHATTLWLVWSGRELVGVGGVRLVSVIGQEASVARMVALLVSPGIDATAVHSAIQRHTTACGWDRAWSTAAATPSVAMSDGAWVAAADAIAALDAQLQRAGASLRAG